MPSPERRIPSPERFRPPEMPAEQPKSPWVSGAERRAAPTSPETLKRSESAMRLKLEEGINQIDRGASPEKVVQEITKAFSEVQAADRLALFKKVEEALKRDIKFTTIDKLRIQQENRIKLFDAIQRKSMVELEGPNLDVATGPELPVIEGEELPEIELLPDDEAGG